MKKLALALLLCASSAFAAWKAEGPYFGSVTAITIDPANSDHMWLSTHGGGVWRSTDGGKTWKISGKLLADRVVSYVVLQPKTTGTLWAGAEDGAMAVSKDGGETWKWVMTDLAQTPHPIAFDPNNPKAIWLPDVNLHKKSIDGGAKWTEFRISGGDAMTFTFDPKDSKTIWAGGVNGKSGLWRSSDAGASWKQMGTGLPEMNRVNRILIDPSDKTTMYMSTPRGGFKSTDGGASWRAFAGGFPDEEVEGLAMSPANSKTLFAGTKKGFWKTTDGGQSWGRISGGFPYYVARAIAFDPKSADVMFVGSGAGVYKSTDGGRSWTEWNGGLAASWIDKVWASASGPIFAQTGQGLFRSDGKGGWSEVLQPFSDDETSLDQIVYDASNPRVIHVADGGFYYRSTDGGATWKRINASFQDPEPTFRTIALDPKNPKVLYSGDANASEDEPSIFKSVDGGVKWKPATSGVSGGIVALLSTPSALYALGRKGTLWRSGDAASTWTKVGGGLPSEDTRAIAATDAAVLVAAKEGLYRSDDNGATFKKTDKRDTEAVVVDGKGVVYIATDEGVGRSTDGGKTFASFNDGLTNHDVRALCSAGGRLYAGTAGGGVFSTDVP
jgi:photosystem II stability/assembly factor-like uncharacterized protein